MSLRDKRKVLDFRSALQIADNNLADSVFLFCSTQEKDRI